MSSISSTMWMTCSPLIFISSFKYVLHPSIHLSTTGSSTAGSLVGGLEHFYFPIILGIIIIQIDFHSNLFQRCRLHHQPDHFNRIGFAPLDQPSIRPQVLGHLSDTLLDHLESADPQWALGWLGWLGWGKHHPHGNWESYGGCYGVWCMFNPLKKS